jgi:MFS family permease
MARWLRETAGGLPGRFWALWTASLINKAGAFVVIFLALYLTGPRHFSPALAGLVLGLYGVGGSVGVTVGGTLADRWGRRPTAILALSAAPGFMLILGLVQATGLIIAAATLLGAAAEMARPALGAMITDLVPEHDRMRAFSMYYWAINLGFSVAAIAAGFAAHTGYLLLFVVDAATTLVAALLIVFKVPETRPVVPAVTAATVATQTVEALTRPGNLRTVLRDRVFLGFVVGNGLVAVVMLQHMSMLPISMQQDGLAPSTFGLVIALNGIMIVGGQLFVTRLLRGRPPSRVLALSALIIGLGFGLTAFAHVPLFYAATVLVWTAGEMLNAPSISTVLAELSPTALRGRYQGVYNLSWQAAAFVAPVLGGFVQQRFGSVMLWVGCFAVCSIAAAWHGLAGPARQRRAAQLRAAAEPVGAGMGR